jgi:hypothetical protein
MGYVVPQPFALGGNRSYLDFWVITEDPWYPRYKTTKVALEPSIDWVAGRSLDRRHNRYPYITVGTTAGFGGEAMGLKPPWS